MVAGFAADLGRLFGPQGSVASNNPIQPMSRHASAIAISVSYRVRRKRCARRVSGLLRR